jgi:hypothetical protein
MSSNQRELFELRKRMEDRLSVSGIQKCGFMYALDDLYCKRFEQTSESKEEKIVGLF